MKYLTEFKDAKIVQKIIDKINRFQFTETISLMEVCGTHTVAIFRNGIKNLLPNNIRLISGPGCPVCVTGAGDIDRAIEIARMPQVIFTTFGDMLRVPGSSSSLLRARSEGADVRIVYSCLDALKIARENQGKDIVFFGIGFETTSPTIAATLVQAKQQQITNFFILSSFKLIPPALDALVTDERLKIDGFIMPGHVSVIIGSHPYERVAKKYHIPCAVAGFEPVDILAAIYLLLKQKQDDSSKVDIQYTRVVHPEGNPQAQALLSRVFKPCDSVWRGLGIIPKSGLRLSREYSKFAAENRYDVKITPAQDMEGCRCDEILKGLITPAECPLFRKKCNPENPFGACMVSSEGTCATRYKYGE